MKYNQNNYEIADTRFCALGVSKGRSSFVVRMGFAHPRSKGWKK